MFPVKWNRLITHERVSRMQVCAGRPVLSSLSPACRYLLSESCRSGTGRAGRLLWYWNVRSAVDSNTWLSITTGLIQLRIKSDEYSERLSGSLSNRNVSDYKYTSAQRVCVYSPRGVPLTQWLSVQDSLWIKVMHK